MLSLRILFWVVHCFPFFSRLIPTFYAKIPALYAKIPCMSYNPTLNILRSMKKAYHILLQSWGSV